MPEIIPNHGDHLISGPLLPCPAFKRASSLAADRLAAYGRAADAMSPTITINTTSDLETVLAFFGPLVGVAVGAGATWMTTRRSSKEAERRSQQREIQRALAAYMAAAELVAVELDSLPAPSWIERQADRIPRRRTGFLFNALLARLVFGRRHDELLGEYQRARAELALLAPVEIIGLTMEVEEFFAEWEVRRTSDFPRQWSDLRDRIRLIAQRTVDEGLGRPYRAGEESARPQG